MAEHNLQPDKSSTPNYVKPYLHTLDRLRDRQISTPEQHNERALGLLEKCFGTSGYAPEVAFSHGGMGLLASHTNYFDGFALIMPLRPGASVAIRHTNAKKSGLVLEESGKTYFLDRLSHTSSDDAKNTKDPSLCLVENIISALAPGHKQLEVAIYNALPKATGDAYLASLVIATARALQALLALSFDTKMLVDLTHTYLERCTNRPFSVAYLIAADAGRPDQFILIDTNTFGHIPIHLDAPSDLGWALLDTGSSTIRQAAFHQAKKKTVDEVTPILQNNGYRELKSLRNLEHRELQHALSVLPRKYKETVRHLVSDNRLVNKMVSALRKQDWQMLGTLMLMSSASLKDDWNGSNDELDFIVETTRESSLDGMYGACISGSGGSVLIAGQPFKVPPCIDDIASKFSSRFKRPLHAMLL